MLSWVEHEKKFYNLGASISQKTIWKFVKEQSPWIRRNGDYWHLGHVFGQPLLMLMTADRWSVLL